MLSIAAVERDTGLSKDTLRVWERRYGFPAPPRDGLGERSYPFDQVERLRTIRRLLEAGHRPGRVVPLQADELNRLAATLDAGAPEVRVVNRTPARAEELLNRLGAARWREFAAAYRLLEPAAGN